MAKRILKSERYLSQLLNEGDEFYVALGYEEVAKAALIAAYGLPKVFQNDLSLIPKNRGPVTKVNVNGKFVRKMPEEKTEKSVQIRYTTKKGTKVDYVRIFHVYVKELQHKFNVGFSTATNVHAQNLLISPLLTYNSVDGNLNIKNTHAINLFLEIFGAFEIYTKNLEPALAFNKDFTFDILPKGTFEDEDVDHLVDGARRILKNDDIAKAFQKRLFKIKSYSPEIIGKGPRGFFGYIVFGFPNKNIVLLESMYNQNATYVIDYAKYESILPMDKQQIIKERLSKKRIYHYDNWERSIEQLLQQ